MNFKQMSHVYPLWIFDLDHEMYTDPDLGDALLMAVAKGFMVVVRRGKCTRPQLKAFIDMLLRHPKSGDARKILRPVLPELLVGRNDDFQYESVLHQYFVECMRPDTDDLSPVNDIPIVDYKPISPAEAILYDRINGQIWQTLYRKAAREQVEKEVDKGKDKEANMGEVAKSEATNNEEEWGEEGMARMKNLLINLINEDDMILGMARMDKRAWDQATKEKTEEERRGEMVMSKLKQLTSPVMKTEIEMGHKMTKRNNIAKDGFKSRGKRLGSSLNMEDEEEVEDRFLKGLEIEEKASTTKGEKGMKSANKRKRR